MKKIILTIVALVGLTANASHFGTFEGSDLNALNKVMQLCPSEMAQSFAAPYTNVKKINFVGGQTPSGITTHYTVNFMSTSPAPSFATTTWELKIIEDTVKIEWAGGIIPMDAPSYETIINCELSDVTTNY